MRFSGSCLSICQDSGVVSFETTRNKFCDAVLIGCFTLPRLGDGRCFCRGRDGLSRKKKLPFLFLQVEVSGSDDEFLTVLAKFRQTLLGISLPPPAPVDYDQALKDARRESIEVRVS